VALNLKYSETEYVDLKKKHIFVIINNEEIPFSSATFLICCFYA